MKIVFLARFLPAEGSTTHMYAIAEKLTERGHVVHIISGGPSEDSSAKTIFENTKKKGVYFTKLPFPIHTNHNLLGKLQQLLYYIMAAPYALIALYKIKPNVVHAHYPVTTYLAYIYRFFSGKKFIVTHHIMGIPKHPLNRKADYVIAISRELQEYLIKFYNYSENQVKLIFNGVSEKKFSYSNNPSSNSKALFKLPSDQVVFGVVGSVSFRKGIDVLIKAFSECKHLKIHLIVLGDGRISWLNELIDENRISDMVTIIPFRDPKEIYNAMDVLILPSRKEGFPLVPIEAMMMKKPVIRSNVEGAYDQIIDGFNGYIFDSENHVQLVSIIEKISLNPELLPMMGENAYNHAITNFTEDIMVDKLLDVYQLTQ